MAFLQATGRRIRMDLAVAAPMAQITMQPKACRRIVRLATSEQELLRTGWMGQMHVQTIQTLHTLMTRTRTTPRTLGQRMCRQWREDRSLNGRMAVTTEERVTTMEDPI